MEGSGNTEKIPGWNEKRRIPAKQGATSREWQAPKGSGNNKKSQVEVKKEIEYSSNQQKRMGESLRSRIDEAENRISDLQDDTEQLKCSGEDYENLKKHKSGITRKCGILWKDQISASYG